MNSFIDRLICDEYDFTKAVVFYFSLILSNLLKRIFRFLSHQFVLKLSVNALICKDLFHNEGGGGERPGTHFLPVYICVMFLKLLCFHGQCQQV